MSTLRISIELSKDDFVQIFKACEDRAARLDALQHQSQDEDVVADAGNDLIEINMIKRSLKAKADETWGASGWTTSEEFLQRPTEGLLGCIHHGQCRDYEEGCGHQCPAARQAPPPGNGLVKSRA